MKIKGETRSIIWDEDNGTSEGYVTTEDDGTAEDDGTGDDKKLFDFLPEKLMTMVEGYQVPAPIQVDYRVLESEIRSLALENLGSQFPGSPNDYLAVQLFKDQSQKWGDIAKQHLNLISAAAMSFTEAVVEHVIAADEKTREAILVEIVDPFFRDRMSTMEGKLQELLRHYTMGIPQPLDEEFQYALSFKARNRLAKTVRRTLDERQGNSPNDVSAAITKANDRTNEYTKVIDMMAVYYKLSLRTFTENVRILAAENCLISVIPDILTPDMVNKMDDEQLMALAAESEDIRVEREHLREQLEVLKQGLEKCRRYGGRQSHVAPSTHQTTTSSAQQTTTKSAQQTTIKSAQQTTTTSAQQTKGDIPDMPTTIPLFGTGLNQSQNNQISAKGFQFQFQHPRLPLTPQRSSRGSSSEDLASNPRVTTPGSTPRRYGH